MTESLATNRSIDTSSETENNNKNNKNSKRRINMSRNKNTKTSASSEEESAKELRKIFPLPVLRHGRGGHNNHTNNNPNNAAPYQMPNPVNRTIMVPDDFTYVSELTSPEESYPNEIPTTKTLTSQNLRAMEAGLQQQQHPPQSQTPNTLPYQPRNDEDDLDDLDDLDGNAEDFSYDGAETKEPRGKKILMMIFCLLVVVAAVAVGVGISQSQRSNQDESVVGPPSDGGSGGDSDTLSPTVSPGQETESPDDAPVEAPSEGQTPSTPEPTKDNSGGSSPTESPIIVVPDPSPTEAPTPGSVPESTPEPTPEPTAGDNGGGNGCVDTLSSTQSCFPPGTPISVSFDVCTPDPNNIHWIGIYPDTGDLDSSNLGDPRYWESSCITSACRREPYSGELPLAVTTLREGSYQLFLVKDDADLPPFSASAIGNTFEVSSNC